MFVGIPLTGRESCRTGGTATAAALVVDSRGRAVGGTYQIFVRSFQCEYMLAHRRVVRRGDRFSSIPADFAYV